MQEKIKDDTISRQTAIDALKHNQDVYSHNFHDDPIDKYTAAIIAADIDSLINLPSAQPEQYTKKELETFLHALSLRLLSLRSAQRWVYDDKTAEELKFLSHLYKKVEADMERKE